MTVASKCREPDVRLGRDGEDAGWLGDGRPASGLVACAQTVACCPAPLGGPRAGLPAASGTPLRGARRPLGPEGGGTCREGGLLRE